MSTIVEEITQGRKTFFIAPDRSLILESYLEDYLTLGYECYFVDTDLFLPISVKIDIILSLFQDSIIFFHIDAPIQEGSWSTVISNAQKKYPNAKFGVMFNKRATQAEKEKIQEYYLFNVGVQCGCIELEYQRKNNFKIVERMLYANQAMGRRKNVRAICYGSCTVQFINKQGNPIYSNISDISASHFSLSFPKDSGIEFGNFEKIKDAQFLVKGLRFKSDCVLYTKRETSDSNIFIFAFCTQQGTVGLDDGNKRIVPPRIYSIMVDNCQDLLGKLFRSAVAKRTELKKETSHSDMGDSENNI